MKVIYHTRGAPSAFDPFGNDDRIEGATDVAADLEPSTGALSIGSNSMLNAPEGTGPGSWSRLASRDPVGIAQRATARSARGKADSAAAILDAETSRTSRASLRSAVLQSLGSDAHGPPIAAPSGAEFKALLLLVLDVLDSLDGKG